MRMLALFMAVFALLLSIYALNTALDSREHAQTAPVRYQVKNEEKTCYVPMCEALGGSDTIALSVMSGD